MQLLLVRKHCTGNDNAEEVLGWGDRNGVKWYSPVQAAAWGPEMDCGC